MSDTYSKVKEGIFPLLNYFRYAPLSDVPFEIPDNWVSVPVSELFYLNPKSEIADNNTHWIYSDGVC